MTGLAAVPTSGAVHLSWTNPTATDYAGALIRRATGTTPPSSPTSGTLIADVAALGVSFDDTTATPGQTYSYAVFAHDKVNNYAAAATATVAVPACTISWTGTAGDLNWGTAGNWTGNRLPGSSDVVCVLGNATDPVLTYSSGTTGIKQLIATRPIAFSGGELDLTATSAASQAIDSSLSGGTINIAGSLSLGGQTTWSSGNLAGSGTTTVPSGSVLTLNDGGCCAATVTSATLTIAGTLDVTGSSALGLYGTAKLVNPGTIDLQGDGSLLDQSGTTSISNSGTLEKTGGTGTSTVGQFAQSSLFDDSGTVKVTSGTLSITASNSSGASDTGSYNVSSGAEIDFAGGTRSLTSGATVTGSGTFAVDGTLALLQNTSPHVPSLTGSGTIQLNGTGGFGHLVVGGSASIGSMSLMVGSGSYDPGCGAAVNALNASSVSGSWATISSPGGPSSGSWQPSVTSTTAGAFVYCPVPSPPTAETYGTGTSYDALNPSGYAAEPVNTLTGAYNTSETDATLGGLGIRFGFTRSYTSSNSYSGPLGLGWTDSLNVFLTPQQNGDVVLNSEDGQQTTFTSKGGGTYQGGPGTRSVLTAQSGGGWLLVRQNQEHFVFNAQGQLTSETDRNGIGLTLSYSGSGQLASVTDYAGRTVTFSYNSAGLLTSMSLPLGRTVSYGYNASNELTSVTDAAGGVTSYGYNGQGLLTTVTNQDGNQVVTNTYDSSGRVVKQVDALGGSWIFSYGSGTTTSTDPNGNSWQDTYNGNVLVQRTDPTGGTTQYAYDSNLELTAVTDPNGHQTTMAYDSSGNKTSETSPLGATKTWTYNPLNDVTSFTDPDGNTTSRTYDAKGNLIATKYADGSTASETRHATTGAMTSFTDTRGHTTSYGYDAQGDLTSTTSPLGEETTYSYDAAGRRTGMASPRGGTTSYGHDADDRLTSIIDPNTGVTAIGYDAVGNRTSLSDPNGNTTSWAYDADNESDHRNRRYGRDEQLRLRRQRQPHLRHNAPRPQDRLQLRQEQPARQYDQPARQQRQLRL